MKTVKWILLSLNLNPYTHIVIRRHTERGVDMLGGSDKVSVILQRFGSLYGCPQKDGRKMVRINVDKQCL